MIRKNEKRRIAWLLVFAFLMQTLVTVNTNVSITEANAYTGYEAVYQNNLSIYTNQRSDDRMMEYLLMEPDNEYAYLINDDIREVCQAITANCNTDMEKLQAIHDWVCNNVYYENIDEHGAGTGVGSIYVFYHRGTRCEGYADLTASMCREVGIPCKEMEGYGYGGLSEDIEKLTIEEIKDLLETKKECSHVWNEAWVDGRWILLDTTWDSNNYKLANHEEVTYAPCSQKYFDMSLKEFSKSHLFLPYISYFEYKFDEWNQNVSTSVPTGTSVQTQETVESNPASQPAATNEKDITKEKNIITEKKPSKPGKVKLISCKSKKKGIVKIKWKKVSGSDGYWVQYSEKRNFSNYGQLPVGKDRKGMSISGGGLKSKKKYYVRVRAYKVTEHSEHVYGRWSKVKAVKVK